MFSIQHLLTEFPNLEIVQLFYQGKFNLGIKLNGLDSTCKKFFIFVGDSIQELDISCNDMATIMQFHGMPELYKSSNEILSSMQSLSDIYHGSKPVLNKNEGIDIPSDDIKEPGVKE
jgi:hypothetical protein